MTTTINTLLNQAQSEQYKKIQPNDALMYLLSKIQSIQPDATATSISSDFELMLSDPMLMSSIKTLYKLPKPDATNYWAELCKFAAKGKTELRDFLKGVYVIDDHRLIASNGYVLMMVTLHDTTVAPLVPKTLYEANPKAKLVKQENVTYPNTDSLISSTDVIDLTELPCEPIDKSDIKLQVLRYTLPTGDKVSFNAKYVGMLPIVNDDTTYSIINHRTNIPMMMVVVTTPSFTKHYLVAPMGDPDEL